MDEKRTGQRQGSRSARVVNVILVETAVGRGTKDDPSRLIREIWSLKGELIAVSDPGLEEKTVAK